MKRILLVFCAALFCALASCAPQGIVPPEGWQPEGPIDCRVELTAEKVALMQPFELIVWGYFEREERPRFKAVELYSWRDAEGAWTFALVDGTNRLKSQEEIRNAPTRYEGVAALEAAFAGLAVGEHVFWLHHVPGFEFPLPELRAEIAAAARVAEIDLAVGVDPP